MRGCNAWETSKTERPLTEVCFHSWERFRLWLFDCHNHGGSIIIINHAGIYETSLLFLLLWWTSDRKRFQMFQTFKLKCNTISIDPVLHNKSNQHKIAIIASFVLFDRFYDTLRLHIYDSNNDNKKQQKIWKKVQRFGFSFACCLLLFCLYTFIVMQCKWQ